MTRPKCPECGETLFKVLLEHKTVRVGVGGSAPYEWVSKGEWRCPNSHTPKPFSERGNVGD